MTKEQPQSPSLPMPPPQYVARAPTAPTAPPAPTTPTTSATSFPSVQERLTAIEHKLNSMVSTEIPPSALQTSLHQLSTEIMNGKYLADRCTLVGTVHDLQVLVGMLRALQ